MKLLVMAARAVCAGIIATSGVARAEGGRAARPQEAVYRVDHDLEVRAIPEGSSKVRVWFWLPDDDDAQKVLDLVIRDAPAGYRITRDPLYGHRYLYAEISNPSGSTLALKTGFTIRRSEVSIALDPAMSGALTEVHRTEFADCLRRDVPNMAVTEPISALANKICGTEENVVKQARMLYDYVVANTSHYSKPGGPKSSGQGSADYCLANGGGACTDQHALFIALARARSIPTRLQFGSRLQPQNEGKSIDPGYRCWVQYFVPNYGWVPMDIAAGNTNPDRRDFYFSGLDERRIRFLEGRDLDLCPKQDGPRLNLMIGAYVEVDGKPYANFSRSMRYTSISK